MHVCIYDVRTYVRTYVCMYHYSVFRVCIGIFGYSICKVTHDHVKEIYTRNIDNHSSLVSDWEIVSSLGLFNSLQRFRRTRCLFPTLACVTGTSSSVLSTSSWNSERSPPASVVWSVNVGNPLLWYAAKNLRCWITKEIHTRMLNKYIYIYIYIYQRKSQVMS